MKNLLILLSIVAISMSAGSCKKVPGCMDQDADNYNFEAEEDDGTCYYSGGAVFYHDQATAQHYLDDGITQTKVFVDGTIEGYLSPNTHWSFIPDCNSTTAVTIPNYGLASAKSKTFTYQVKDQNNQLLTSGTFTIYGNQCTAVEVIY
ncbi:MAG: hypothetical protein KDC13_05510 [Bacteroidetes bacterium]|nr:hypothetical protein [Bacteroidota bacterium]